MMINKAILLVGGKGTRLAPLTNKVPKPMLKVAGKPVTEHQIVKARDAGITELVLATSYLAEVFEPYFGDGRKWDMKISYAIEDSPLGTGGAIANAAAKLKLAADESVVIFNGDVLSGHDLSAQMQLHDDVAADVTLYLTRVEDPRAYGCVPLNADKRVMAFLEKMENPIADTINAGCYIFRREALQRIPRDTVVSVERDTFPELLANAAKLYGYLDDKYWIDMGTPQSFIKASKDLIMNPSLSAATQGVEKEVLIAATAQIDATAQILSGSTIAAGCHIAPDVEIIGSMIQEDVVIGAGSKIVNSYVAAGITLPAGSTVINEVIG